MGWKRHEKVPGIGVASKSKLLTAEETDGDTFNNNICTEPSLPILKNKLSIYIKGRGGKKLTWASQL
jgi:hypothetical protein